jgi:hypothetical protein
MDKPTIGRIIQFFPKADDKESTANGATSVPAIITQVFDGNDTTVNLRVFQNDVQSPLFKTSVHHKSDAQEGEECWDWFQKV